MAFDGNVMLSFQVELNNTKQNVCETLSLLGELGKQQLENVSVHSHHEDLITALQNRCKNHEQRMSKISEETKKCNKQVPKVQSVKSPVQDFKGLITSLQNRCKNHEQKMKKLIEVQNALGAKSPVQDSEALKKEIMNNYSRKTQEMKNDLVSLKKEMLDVISKGIQNIKLELDSLQISVKEGTKTKNTGTPEDLKKLKNELLNAYSRQNQSIKESMCKMESQVKNKIALLQKELKSEKEKTNSLERRLLNLEKIILGQNPQSTSISLGTNNLVKHNPQTPSLRYSNQRLAAQEKSISCQNLTVNKESITVTSSSKTINSQSPLIPLNANNSVNPQSPSMLYSNQQMSVVEKSVSCQDLSGTEAKISSWETTTGLNVNQKIDSVLTNNSNPTGKSNCHQMSLADYMAGCSIQQHDISFSKPVSPVKTVLNVNKNTSVTLEKKEKSRRRRRRSKKATKNTTNMSDKTSSSASVSVASSTSSLDIQENTNSLQIQSKNQLALNQNVAYTSPASGIQATSNCIDRADKILQFLQAKKTTAESVLVTVDTDVVEEWGNDDSGDDSDNDSDETTNEGNFSY